MAGLFGNPWLAIEEMGGAFLRNNSRGLVSVSIEGAESVSRRHGTYSKRRTNAWRPQVYSPRKFFFARIAVAIMGRQSFLRPSRLT